MSEKTLREIMEQSRSIPISAGGLAMLIEKIVEEIEKLQERVQGLENE